MRPRFLAAVSAALAVLVAVCIFVRRAGARSPAPASPPASASARGSATPRALAAFPEQSQLWQGFWVVRDASYPGSVQAWDVGGAYVSVYDAQSHGTERETFALLSPCRLARTRTLDKNSERIYDTFAFAGDGLHVASAPASGGVRRGDLVVACFPNAVYAYQPATRSCWQWDPNGMGPAGDSDSECVVDGTGPSTSFVLRPYNGGVVKRLDFYGAALLSQPLLAHVAERLPTFEAAMRRADALE